ncbi:YpmS family protein [Amphibacillus jilinensis]|uniref:YpmS family protein n=1 Tax=Amphibacillus jilinensis TaxID=1216008 RepID=UPI00030C055D|nr:YpmS family protein [Amphibacillus jilinensis]
MKEIKQGNKKMYKRYFLMLLSVNLVLLMLFIVLILVSPPRSDVLPTPQYIDEPGAEFRVESTKEDLNELINDYLDQVLLADNAEFSVHIDQDVHLFGSFQAFGASIPLNVRMEPNVQANGDLILSMTEMSLGLLDLPSDRILHYINQQISTPDWLYFDSENEQLYVAVTQIDVQSNFRFSVQELDLTDDNISFLIKIPRAGAIQTEDNDDEA